jgi:hypothetical protein
MEAGWRKESPLKRPLVLPSGVTLPDDTGEESERPLVGPNQPRVSRHAILNGLGIFTEFSPR